MEITSCGLNGEPLQASGIYPAGIACHVTDATTQDSIDYNNPVMQKQTRITEKQEGRTAIYFRFTGKGKVDMRSFGFCE